MPQAHSATFLDELRTIVGEYQVLADPRKTQEYRQGFRYGGGSALAVVRPGSLLEQWRVVSACVAANKIIVLQAANTGLTGGSTPHGEHYDREVVILNTLRMAKVFVLEGGKEVICLPGATLYQLEKALVPYGREPHSVIGSSCIGASVVGGICNNSGGALVRRGPAFTQMALYAQLDELRQLHLVNHLGVNLGESAEEILTRLEHGKFDPGDIAHDPTVCGSDHDYGRRVREIDSDRPARFNADPMRLFEASGSAGKIAVFAVRLDTFPKDQKTRVFYIGTRDPAELTGLRRHMLARFQHLPVAGEYLHRDLFDVAEKYGKDAFLTIEMLGTERLPALFKWKARYDALISRPFWRALPKSDALFQALGSLFPSHLPRRMKGFRDRFEHHLILKMADDGMEEAASHLKSIFPSRSGDFFECTEEEARKAFLHRFVAAGAAIRYQALHGNEIEDILALDIALRKNEPDWFEELPEDVRSKIHLPLYYGHFFCHVFHQDYLVRTGCDVEALKKRLLGLLDARGAQYPAEHNVGHLYRAAPALAEFYRSLDACNQFNPGIGQTSGLADWKVDGSAF